MEQTFTFAQYWWAYILFGFFVIAMMILDLGVLHRKTHKVGMIEAGLWTLFWITLAGFFCLGLYQYVLSISGAQEAGRLSLEFLAGYVMELCLSVDNLFVFILVFQYFKVPEAYKHRVLFLGIVGAIFFRALFIAFGSVLFQFEIVMVIFGVLLIYSGLKLLFAGGEDYEPARNPAIKVLGRFLPMTSDYRGNKFFVRNEGKLHGTPLLVCLVVIEISDIIFAFDSVPAVFALTKEPFIVFTSNIFAVLGLRSLFFLLSGLMRMFVFLQYGLGLILVFIGLKMTIIAKLFEQNLPIIWSLGFILSILTFSVLLSLLVPAHRLPEELRKKLER